MWDFPCREDVLTGRHREIGDDLTDHDLRRLEQLELLDVQALNKEALTLLNESEGKFELLGGLHANVYIHVHIYIYTEREILPS